MPWSFFKRRRYVKRISVRLQRDPPSFKSLLLKAIMGQAGSVNFQEKELDVFRGSDQSILNCEVGPDGKILATCSADSTVYLWKLPTDSEPGELLQSLQGHKQEVTSCSFSGPILASASQNGEVILWHHKTGKRASRLAVHAGAVYDCVFANDGQSLATSSKDTTIRRFKIKPGAGEFVPGSDTRTLSGRHGHRCAVSALAFTPDDGFIISGSEDGVIKKWSRKDAQCTDTHDSRYGPVRSLRFPVRYPPAEEIFASLSGSNVVIWNNRETTMDVRQVLDVQGRHIQAISFVPNSSYLVGVSSDNCLSVWDPLSSSPRPISVKPISHEGHIQCCCFDPQGRYFVTADSSGYIKIWF